MRITGLISIWADGQKALPTIIHKGAKNSAIQRQIGPILYISQRKAWVHALLIIKWIDSVFPLVGIAVRNCIVWDSCKVHIAKNVKELC